MPAQAVQCPGCSASTASYPDPHGVRICTYCGTQFNLGAQGARVLGSGEGIAATAAMNRKGSALVGLAAGVLLLAGVAGVLIAQTNTATESSGSTVVSSGVTADAAAALGAVQVPVVVEAVAPPAPEKPPMGEFEFHHTRSSNGSTFYVLGRITNTGEVPLDHAKLIVVLKDEQGQEVGTDFGFAQRDVIFPGESSPVSALVKDPPAHASMDFEFTPKKASYFPAMVEGLKLEGSKVGRAKYGGAMTAEGKVRNDGDTAAKFVEVEVHGLDPEGKLLGISTTYAEGDTLEPGATARFKVLSMYFDEAPANYEFYVSGRVAK